jgi:hypothetical protein
LGVVGMRPSKKWMLTSSHWNDPTTLGISPIENPRKPTQTGAQWTRNGKMVFYPIPYVTIGPTHFPEVWLVHTSLNWETYRRTDMLCQNVVHLLRLTSTGLLYIYIVIPLNRWKTSHHHQMKVGITIFSIFSIYLGITIYIYIHIICIYTMPVLNSSPSRTSKAVAVHF